LFQFFKPCLFILLTVKLLILCDSIAKETFAAVSTAASVADINAQHSRETVAFQIHFHLCVITSESFYAA